MKLLSLLLAAFAAITTCETVAETSRQTSVYVEPVNSPSSVQRVVEIEYDPVSLTSEIISFDPLREFPEDELLRIGVYDPRAKSWASSTTVTAAATFSKGYSPIIVVHVDGRGDILSVSCKSGRVDAGHTRDFGPKVKVLRTEGSKSPELNKPVILSKEGKVEAVEPEKTFLQKYWMVFVGITVVLLMSGGGEK